MSTIPMVPAPPKVAEKKSLTKKYWGKSKPVRQVLGLVFVLHGWLRLGGDIAGLREPFFLSDVREWSRWLGDRWNDLYEFVTGFGGVDVEVNGG